MDEIESSEAIEDLLDDESTSSEEDTGAVELEDMLRYSSVKEIVHLMRSEKLSNHLQKIETVTSSAEMPVGTGLSDDEYQLIVESNNLVVEIETEIRRVHKFLKDHYNLKFPELESLVLNPIEYARVVKVLGNEMDTTNVDLAAIIPPHTIMVVNVTGSTTAGKPLPPDELERVLEGCEEMLQLDEAKQIILEYVQSRMSVVAPNLSVIVGTAIASQLIGAAGGLRKLAALPATVIQRLGRSRKTLTGFSASSQIFHGGFLLQCDLVKTQSDPRIKKRAVRLVSGKIALAARFDATQVLIPAVRAADGTTSARDTVGRQYREEIEKKIAKWKEPPPAKQEKSLPAPDDRPKKKRGGKRARAAKERYKVTELRKFQNRIEFAGDTEEVVSQTGGSVGMLGKMGSGLLRLRPETKVKSKRAKLLTDGSSTAAVRGRESSGGLSSSLVFTPIQGLELPAQTSSQKPEPAGSKYFSATHGFKTPAPRTPSTVPPRI